MQLYGKKWMRRELEARVGRLEQIGGIRRLTLTEGAEKEVELIQVRTGAGLTYYVSPMRGLDISLAEFAGFPISWQAPAGDTHPAFYDATGMEWLRTAVGGLLMTCGLRQVGSPCEDQGESPGLHGRAHHLPARHVSAQSYWIGDEHEMVISGIIEESKIFGEYMRLTRKITSILGANWIQIQDRVENIGFAPSPHMILYHFNFGFPLMSEGTKIIFPSRRVIARELETPRQGYDQWQPPTIGYRERVYYHEGIEPGFTFNGEEWASVVIQNPQFPYLINRACTLIVRLSWSTKNLPRLIQWKMPGAGVHVLGIEPANCYVEGRAKERARGTLITLEPGQVLVYNLKLEIEAS